MVQTTTGYYRRTRSKAAENMFTNNKSNEPGIFLVSHLGSDKVSTR